MREKGKIIDLKKDIAVVLMEEKEKCSSCGLCKKIIERKPIIEAKNEINAKIGDNVEVEINEDTLFKISLFIYGIPIVGFITGIFLSYFFKNHIFKVIIFLISFISLTIFGFKKGNYYGEKSKPKIISKI